ncbi:MAG: hypothetical protein H6733_11295 [Alphaproteobacteria bacterium]|nr:hypothetical protein [Alphaproteobacteria bacterium]
MLLLWLSTALAAPSTLRGDTSGQLFQDPLDLAAQPARLAEAQALDLYTFAALRNPGTTLGLAIVAPVPNGNVAASAGWSHNASVDATVDLRTNDATIARANVDVGSADLAWGGPVSGRFDVGAGLFFRGTFQRSGAAFDPDTATLVTSFPATLDDHAAPWTQLTDQWTLGGRLGLVAHGDRATTDVHLALDLHRDATSARGHTDGVTLTGSPLPPDNALSNNRAGVTPSVTVDTLVPTGERTAFRGWFQVGVDVDHTAIDTSTLVVSPTLVGLGVDRTVRFVPDYDHDVDAAFDARLLGHVQLDGRGRVALRVGGRLSAAYRDARVVWVTTDAATGFDAGEGRILRRARLAVGVPLAVEVAVHPKVVFRVSAEGTWSWSQTDEASGAADPDDLDATARGAGTRRASQGLSGRGAVGVAWRPVDVLSWEATVFGTGTTGVAATVGDLWLATSLVFHL